MDRSPPPVAPWQAGLRGARANLLPGIVLQVLAVALVVCYYYLPSVHASLDDLSAYRQRSGYISG
ncbi:MAG TPA: hypothetical protein VFE25_14190, partial [Opitutaceae bacterium]|nr:hypothetical protein [Opitutaceae bacterium]